MNSLFFSCCLYNPLLNFGHFYYNMSWCRSLWGQLVWDPLCFPYLDVSFFRFGKFAAIISSNTFSVLFSLSSPPGISIMRRLAHFILSHRSLILLSFFKFGFLSAVLIG